MAKSKYETSVKDKLILVEAWARNGLTNDQIAKNLGIGKTTFYKYVNEHKELLEHLKKGKEIIDFEVENALLKRALGYEYDETKTYIEEDKEGNKKKKIEKTRKSMAPDITAQIFWLKNRKPTEWRDKQIVQEDNDMQEDDGFINALESRVDEVWED